MTNLDELYQTVLDYIYVVGMGVAAICVFISGLWGRRKR
jgi:hypothetical protein